MSTRPPPRRGARTAAALTRAPPPARPCPTRRARPRPRRPRGGGRSWRGRRRRGSGRGSRGRATSMPSASSARTTSASSALPSSRRTATPPRSARSGARTAPSTVAHPLAVRLVRRRRLDGRPADLGLERVRRALGDDLAGVDDPDPVGERVGLLEVLGGEEDGHALVGGEPRDLVPERGAALHVEAGGRLVEEQDRAGCGPAPGRGRGAGACRPSSRRPCGRPRRRARPARSARRRGAAPRPSGCPCIPACRRMCSRAVRNWSSAASWSATPICVANRRGPRLTMSWPATRAVPAVGGSRVVSMWTVVDLPAPLGPRKP